MKLRLRDLNNIAREKPDYSIIMKEILGFKNRKIGRRFVFGRMFRMAFHLVKRGQELDLTKCEVNPESKIKVPNNIDSISFKAMMELQSVMATPNSEDVVSVIAEIITIVTYSVNTGKSYRIDNILHQDFREKVLNQPLEDMMGLYNWIIKSAAESKAMWEERFFSVQVIDEEYEEAGGDRMSQFNVINTIKSLCRDFNCTESEAWQKSYGLSQTNSYAIATSRHIEDNMRQAKELKMKRERQKSGQV